CIISTAPILSITFFLPFLLTSASINVLFAAIVDKRSSSKKTGRENFFFNRLAYLSEKIARSLKEPFICFGRPITIFETSYSCIKLFSSLSDDDLSFSSREIVLTACAVNNKAALTATPIVFEATSSPRALIFFLSANQINKIYLALRALHRVQFFELSCVLLYIEEY